MTIYEIDKELGLKQVGENYWQGVMIKGSFDGLYDYDRGIYTLAVRCFQPIGKNQVIVSLSTIDDGVWTADSDCFKKENIDKLARDIINAFGQVLPTEEVFNNFLQYYKLYGVNTG
jgi:hypothetical protein